MKTATVSLDSTGWWVVIDNNSGNRIGGLCESELDAYRIANGNGYIVV